MKKYTFRTPRDYLPPKRLSMNNFLNHKTSKCSKINNYPTDILGTLLPLFWISASGDAYE